MPASIEFIASSLFRIQRNAHLTVLRVSVEALRNKMIEKYSGVKDFFNCAIPLSRDFNDLSSCRMQLMMSPYLTCFSSCLRVSIMQPLGCLQKWVLASRTFIRRSLGLIEILQLYSLQQSWLCLQSIRYPMTERDQKIQYRVSDSQKYRPYSSKFKQISKINEQSHQFEFETESDSYELELKFTSHAIITKIQFKVANTNQIMFQFYDNAEKIVRKGHLFEEKDLNENKMRTIDLKDEAKICNRCIVRLLNSHTAKRSRITCIIFRGFKQGEEKKKIRTVKNVSEKDSIEVVSKKKVEPEDRQVFNMRQKQKSTKKTSPQGLVESLHQFEKTHKNKQQEELYRVLKQSERQYEEKLKSQKKAGMEIEDQQRPQRIPQTVYIDDEENQFFDYDVVQYDKVKSVYEHVTPEWVQAQRAAQQRRQIQSRHSIANRIKPKIFNKLQFCINGIFSTEKGRLIKILKQLGGQYIEQPKPDCYIITNKMQGGRINASRNMPRIKYVISSYIEDCDRNKARLDQKQYRPKQ